MEIKPTVKGVELCIKNSLRLLEDTLLPGLSLPTVGALCELGLEEAAKVFLILICLEKSGKISKKTSIVVGQSFSESVARLEESMKERDCQKQLNLAFQQHKVKTKILKSLGDILKSIPAETEAVKKQTTDFLKSIDPNLTDKYLNDLLAQPGVLNNASKQVADTGKILEGKLYEIKELGFYVNWDEEESDFRYPKIDRDNMIRLVGFLYSMIIAFKNLAELLDIKFEVDIRDLSTKLSNLDGRIK